MTFDRRVLLGLASALPVAALPGRQAAALRPSRPVATRAVAPEAPLKPTEWEAFCARYILPEGRVVDTANGGISHSEGQGWAMLCAERMDDRASFDRLLDWTRRTLPRPGDALFAWRYRPEARGNKVEDTNNATDGDLMIAWALLRAGARWQDPGLTAEGKAIARDILRLLVRQVGEDVVLLPGARGFEQHGYVVVNPSYYTFPALPVLARAVPDPLWLRLAADGLKLLRRARFGRWGLPPDWLALPRGGGAPIPAPGWPPRFSYDAVRVPLYLAWAGLGREPVAASAARFWTDPRHPSPPAWADLSQDTVSPYAAPSGVRAIARLAVARAGAEGAATDMPSIADANDYYSAALTLLAHLAWRDSTT